eukprot:scaffold51410_cov36-Prasinocladus_malaysianus.AAC.2
MRAANAGKRRIALTWVALQRGSSSSTATVGVLPWAAARCSGVHQWVSVLLMSETIGPCLGANSSRVASTCP